MRGLFMPSTRSCSFSISVRFAFVLACIATCAALCACESRPTPTREWTPADHGQPSDVDPSRVPREEEAAPEAGGQERAAAALWNVSCASCHGRDGKGLGMAKPPGAQIADFTTADFQKTRSDPQLAQVISTGRGMMPGFEKQVNEQGIAALVAHIRRFGASEPETEAPSR